MRTNVLLAALVVYAASISNAFAYLDPGTGSILLQALIGGIAASVTVVSLYYQRVKAFFTGRSATKQIDGK